MHALFQSKWLIVEQKYPSCFVLFSIFFHSFFSSLVFSASEPNGERRIRGNQQLRIVNQIVVQQCLSHDTGVSFFYTFFFFSMFGVEAENKREFLKKINNYVWKTTLSYKSISHPTS